MKAWIVKWNWIGDHAAVEKPLVAIVSARMSSDTIKRHVELLYAARQSLGDQIELARYNKPRQNAYPAEFVANWAGAITCGHNPFLEAFLADDVRVIQAPDGSEDVSFKRRKPPKSAT